jgi:MFS family permease
MFARHSQHAGDLVNALPGPVRALLPLYAVVFIGFVGYAAMVTLFVPMLMGDHGYVAADTPRSTRVILAGALLAMYPLGQFFGSPIIGALSDRFGRKPVLMLSLTMTSACYVGIASALQWHRLDLIFVMCFVCGLAESNIAIAQSVIADVTSSEERGKYFGFSYVACSLGFVTGPLIGGLLVRHYGFAVPFWAVLGLLLATWVFIAMKFRETHQRAGSDSLGARRALTNLIHVFTDRPIRRLYLVNFLIYFGAYGYFRVILIYWVDEWNMPVDRSTMFYSYVSMACLLSNLLIMPKLPALMSMKTLTIGAALLGGMLLIVVLLPRVEWSTWLTVAPAGVVIVLGLSACAALLSSQVSAARQGSVMGNNQALQVGAESISAAIGGSLAALWIPLPMLTCAVTVIASGVVLWTYRVRRADEIT